MKGKSSKRGNSLPIELTFDQLYEGYSKSIETAWELLTSGQKLFRDHASIALGLFQIGQEEVGRSLSFLAAFNFSKGDSRWARFFHEDEWKNHQKKAHRAFLYEIICPIRISTFSKAKNRWMDGFTQRNKISAEKEAALYVNYHAALGKFLSPMENVAPEEVTNRYATLLYLSTTAQYIKAGLDMETDLTKEENYRLFSDIPERIITQNIYQQDFPAIIEEFKKRSKEHAAIGLNLKNALDSEKKVLTSTMDQFNKRKKLKSKPK